MNDFGIRLQTLRKQRGLTQKNLAERINKSLSAVSSYETNVQVPPVDVLISIASVLNVSLDYLIGFEHKNIIITDRMSTQQEEVLRMLVAEFTSPSGRGRGLSNEQKEILDRLLCLFFDR